MSILSIGSNAGIISHVALIRSAALALSVLVHGALFVSFGDALHTSHASDASAKVIQLSFFQPGSVPEKGQEQPEEIQKQADEVKAQPEEVPAQDDARVKEAPKKAEPVKKVAKAASSKKAPPKMESQEHTLMVTAPSEAPQLDQGLILLEKKHYMHDVLTHIEHHKWYPRIARRMGIEGDVKVRFIIHADGSAHDLLIENGPETLMAAARKTVERSLPLPTPPEKVDCPLECEFRMRFSLSGVEHD